MTLPLVRSAIQHLAKIGSVDDYPLYEIDRETFIRLTAPDVEWSANDQREALMLFAKYRRILIRDGFDYYTVFPKNKYNHDVATKVKRVYGYMDYLVKSHGIKPPHGFDLMPLDDAEKWVREMVVAVRIKNARRNADPNTVVTK